MRKKNEKIDSQMTTTAIAQCSIFVVLMMVTGVVIKIPFPLVPLTFQTVTCVLAGLLLGWKKCGLSMLAYTVFGLIGVPIFAAGGGIFYVLKPSFGYVLGFIAGAVVAGMVRGNSIKAPLWRYILAAVLAFVANYAVGIVYFIIVWVVQYTANGLGAAIVTYNLLYMPKDIVLCVLAGVLSWKLAPIVLKRFQNNQK